MPGCAAPEPRAQAASGSHWRQAGGIVGVATWMKMCGDGARGAVFGCMLAWWGRWSPLRRLHGAQQATMLSHSAEPPLDRGITWSTVRFEREPQYWQVQRSRA